ncbi:MAG: MBL fold metallo-hydrolase [Calditrichaeota bacterium]|nr:MAG: MBL fold metallo-hydrolase [Calditrichota bacterium]
MNGAAGTEPALTATMLISHTHHDHIQGLPYFAPAYRAGTVLHVYGPRTYSDDLVHVLSRTMEPQYSPIRLDELNSQMNIHNLSDSEEIVLKRNSQDPEVRTAHQAPRRSDAEARVRVMRSYAHPKDGVFVFRVEVNDKSVVYATDTEGYVSGDRRLAEFAEGADLLIHDAQYTPDEYADASFPKQGFGHSTYVMAAEVAEKAGAKNLVLFHHDPSHDDTRLAEMEKQTRELFPNTTAGYEGLEYRF